MKKMIAVLMSVALVAVLAVPALAAEPFYANEETSPYDNCQGNRSCPMWYFADLAGNTWYHDGVHYCLDRMLMVGRTGPEDGTFDPDGRVTRDDLVRTLYRSAIEFGADVSVGEDTNILSYTDAFDVHIVREEFIPEGTDTEYIEKLTALPGVRLAGDDGVFDYMMKPGTDHVVEMLTLSFVRARK